MGHTYPVHYGPADGETHKTPLRPKQGDAFIWRHPWYMLAYLYEFRGERWVFAKAFPWNAKERSDCRGK